MSVMTGTLKRAAAAIAAALISNNNSSSSHNGNALLAVACEGVQVKMNNNQHNNAPARPQVYLPRTIHTAGAWVELGDPDGEGWRRPTEAGKNAMRNLTGSLVINPGENEYVWLQYKGAWDNDRQQPQGQGELHWLSQNYGVVLHNMYLGTFEAGKFHGQGTRNMRARNQEVSETDMGFEHSGQFVHGFLTGKGNRVFYKFGQDISRKETQIGSFIQGTLDGENCKRIFEWSDGRKVITKGTFQGATFLSGRVEKYLPREGGASTSITEDGHFLPIAVGNTWEPRLHGSGGRREVVNQRRFAAPIKTLTVGYFWEGESVSACEWNLKRFYQYVSPRLPGWFGRV